MNSSDGGAVVGEMQRWAARRRVRGEITAGTYATNMSHIRRFTAWFGADTPLVSISTLDIEDWLVDDLGPSVAPRTQNLHCSTLRTFWDWAVARGLVPSSPMAGIKPVPVPKDVPRRIPPALAAEIMSAADDRQRAMIALALHLGMRVEEIHVLRVEDVDFERDLVLVRGKGSKQRVLPLGPEVRGCLRRWMNHPAVGQQTSPAGRPYGPMWPNKDGEALSYDWVAQVMTDASHAVGAHVTPHQYRHTFASESAMGDEAEGIPPMPTPVLQAFLGHESLATTSRYATAVAAELKAHVSRRRYLRSTGGVVRDIGDHRSRAS